MAFTTLTDEEEKELNRLSRFYWQEALRCEKAQAYLAGSVMLGSALETMLILMINCYSDEADQTGKVPTIKKKPKALLNWKYIELLRVAKAANWLPSALDLENEWSSRKARIGDYAEVVSHGAQPRASGLLCGGPLSWQGYPEVPAAAV